LQEKVRIQKILSQCGVASRRKAEKLILEEKVKINNILAKIGDRIDPEKDIIKINNKKINIKKKKYYIILNKPRGYITTMCDEKGRKTVLELIKNIPERVFPVGRLDRNSEGLLLFTNDGEFANSIIHPSKHVSKTYLVTVNPEIKEWQIDKLKNGMIIDGEKTMPAEVFVNFKNEKKAVLKIILKEGKNRQIRKMCEILKIKIKRLKRVSIGNLDLNNLPLGAWRELDSKEIAKIIN